VLRDELNRYLAGLYEFEKYDDYCLNGLQVEGKEKIEKIVLGVSFNLLFLNGAIKRKADALVVHHGFFGRDFFVLKGHRKNLVKLLLKHDISLFGIHLPMDGHPRLGHNARLFGAIGAPITGPLGSGFRGKNVKNTPLEQILETFHHFLHEEDHHKDLYIDDGESGMHPLYSFTKAYGFGVFQNGPAVPQHIAIVSGGGAGEYEHAVLNGIDTFICGELKEQVPAISYETASNFIYLGHYNSEKPGIRALKDHLGDTFPVETEYIGFANVV
jgi:dinuclear metal center YbgI/SA1388 family protein